MKNRQDKSSQYQSLSQVYDQLMGDVNYPKWAEYLVGLMQEQGEDPINILELGCGTGNITLQLLEKGYEVVGIDISEEMLEIAREKTQHFGDKIILLAQDITKLDFDVYEIDCVVMANDTFNYITDKNKIKKLLEYLHPRLKVGGQLIFDISSYHKLKNTLGNNVFGESFEDMAFLWENYFDEASEQVTMEINIFSKQAGLYKRETETHIQKAYHTNEIEKILQDIGYRNIRIYGDFNKKTPIIENAQRIFFSCVR